MNIKLPILKSNYFGIYETEEQYNNDIENRKEELSEAFFAIITNGDNTTPDEYQYSIRTTNNDNQVMGRYNINNALKNIAFYNVVFGILGWKNTEVEFEGQHLYGGYFTNAKNLITVPYAIDTFKLKNINYFIYYCPNVKEISNIDLSNVVSADYAFSSENNRRKAIKNLQLITNLPNLQKANNFFENYTLSTGEKDDYIFSGEEIIFNFPNLKEANNIFGPMYYISNDEYSYANLKLNAPNVNINNLFSNYLKIDLINNNEVDFFGLYTVSKFKTSSINGYAQRSCLYVNISELSNIIIIYDFDKWFDLEDGTIIDFAKINNGNSFRYIKYNSIYRYNLTIKIICTKYKLQNLSCIGIKYGHINSLIIDDVTKNNILSHNMLLATNDSTPNYIDTTNNKVLTINNISAIQINYNYTNHIFNFSNCSLEGDVYLTDGNVINDTDETNLIQYFYNNGVINFKDLYLFDYFRLEYVYQNNFWSLKLYDEDTNYNTSNNAVRRYIQHCDVYEFEDELIRLFGLSSYIIYNCKNLNFNPDKNTVIEIYKYNNIRTINIFHSCASLVHTPKIKIYDIDDVYLFQGSNNIENIDIEINNFYYLYIRCNNVKKIISLNIKCTNGINSRIIFEFNNLQEINIDDLYNFLNSFNNKSNIKFTINKKFYDSLVNESVFYLLNDCELIIIED